MSESRNKFIEDLKVLTDLKSSFETSSQPRVIGKEKSVEERLKDLDVYIEEDIDL